MSDLTERIARLSPAQRQLLERRAAASREAAEPIAIVGMACRFAGAPSLDAFWRVIRDGVDATSEVPPSRWNVDEHYSDDPEAIGKMSTRRGGFIDDVDQFDPLFFGITPRETERMDPQQRVLLEVAWEAFENAGLAPEKMRGTATGVFVGIGGSDYTKPYQRLENYFEIIDAHVGTGNALSIAANRVSYVLDLHGPSLAVDTACSSALVGIHLAVQSLRNGECEAALAGGVNLILAPDVTMAFSKAHMLSPEGRCRPFDSRANGYVRGEGCGLLVLKRLTQAVRDGDNVLAIIRGTAVNQDGRTSGITAPSSQRQEAVIRSAMAEADLTPHDIGYVEAHGTATPLGDPIEVQSLAEIFKRRAPTDRRVFMSSVKANIGHTETASGVAGIIKTVLSMRHNRILPQVHFQELNPHIQLDGARLVIPTESIDWPDDVPKIAGVSSFGFGGTNAHVILEGAEPRKAATPKHDRPLHVMALAAKSPAAIASLAGRHADHAAEHPEHELAELCHSANTGRTHFNHRLTLSAATREQLLEQLAAVRDGRSIAGVKQGQLKAAARPRVAFLFTGQGSQYPNMGRELFDTQPTFRRTLEQCDELLRPDLGESLLSILYPTSASDLRIHETRFTQPALFSIEYSLATLWRSWGIVPELLLGHSVGEYVAACVSGVMTLEDALWLIAQRARLMDALPRDGSMAVVFGGLARVTAALAGHQKLVSIAAANGPENTVISGDTEAVRRIVAQLESDGISAKLLTVSHAFHSPLMEPMLDEFERLAGEIEYRKARIPLVSNVTGELAQDGTYNARYWRDHVRSAVRFADGVARLEEHKLDAVLEVGPTTALLGMARRCAPQLAVKWLPSLREGQPNWNTMLDSLADLYVAGANVNWVGFDRDWTRRRVTLPTYPFERTRHWLDAGTVTRKAGAARGPSLHPLLGCRLPTPLDTTLFEVQLSSHSPRYLVDHEVQGSPVLPAAAYVEQGLIAADQVFGPGRHTVENVVIGQAMFLTEGQSRAVQISLSPEAGGERSFEVYSLPVEADPAKTRWTMHASGKLRHGNLAGDAPPASVDLDALRSGMTETTDRATFYELMASRGLVYGPAFQVLTNLMRSDREALAEIRLSEEVLKESVKYHLHPALLDACLQGMAGAVPPEADGSLSPFTYMPTGIGRVRMHDAPSGEMFAYVVRTSSDNTPSPETVEANVRLLDSTGRVIVELDEVRVQRLGRGTAERSADPRDWLYQVEWRPSALERASTKSEQASSLPGNWLVFADKSGVADSLVATLRTCGARCILVSPSETFLAGDANGHTDHFRINPNSGDDYRRLLQAALGVNPSCRGVVHLWSLDTPEPGSDAGAFDQARRLGCGSVLPLVQQLAKFKFSATPSLWLVTKGAQPVAAADEAVAVMQSPVWGLGRVAAVEHPELHCRLLDLDAASPAGDAANCLVDEFLTASADDQIAYRAAERRVARLVRSPGAVPEESQALLKSIPRGDSYRVRLGKPGSMDSLRFESFLREKPTEGQVEIEVRAAGLNFSDVLKALGLYPGIKDTVVPLGIECSGVVTAIGDGVSRFKVGDAVMGVAPYSFASHARTAEFALVPKPASIDDCEACTVPITFLTAYYGLVRLAQLAPGERVLIHAGAGGVGLAAIQIAQHLGAEVFATAGSDEKREFLRSLGVEHVLNSRNLDFVEDVLRITNRKGVDVVLNSLAGDAIPKSLGLLTAFGRFLEIGKTDIYQNRMLGLSPFQDNLSYFAIDLDRMLRQRPDYVKQLFAEVMQHFDAGIYRPLAFTQFAMQDVVGAFRYMAQRKNIGKVVVAMEPASDANSESPAESRPSGTCLITGGLGALGTKIARWLSERGTRHLALMSRREPNASAQEQIDELRQSGASVAVVLGDVADTTSLDAAIAQIPADFPPLSGVVHAAGVIDDGLLFDMDEGRLARAMDPKIRGAWNLHEATLAAPLDYFITFSSVASLLGSPGQGNYAAGNAFLDSLTAYRRSQGLRATSINWGPWAESGMAANDELAKQLASRGMDLLPAEKCFQLLGGLLDSQAPATAVMNVRWQDMLAKMTVGTPPLLLDLAPAAGKAVAAEQPADAAFRQEMLSLDRTAREARLRDFFTGELASIMGLDKSTLDAEQPLNTLGLDSLMALELKNKIESRLKVALPIARFMEGPSVRSLAAAAAELMDATAAPVAPTARIETTGGRQPLTPGQQSLWFIQQLAPESGAYHVCDAVRAFGDLRVEAVESALQALVDRHSALRTSFHEEDGRPYQIVHPRIRAPFELVDATGWTELQIKERVAEEVHRPFDLEQAPLLRLVLLRESEDRYLMVLVVHHIIADLFSMVLCIGELRQFYAAALIGEEISLPAPAIEFGEFARRQSEMLESAEGERLWKYWENELAGELPILELSTDRPRPPVQTYNGELLFHTISPEIAGRLDVLGQRNNVTLNMVLLAGYEMLLARYTGQDEILVGTPASGRTSADVEKMIGYFVNPVVVRGDLTQNPTVAEFLAQIREKVIGSLEHQDYPFSLLVERLAPERDSSRTPIFQTMFAMQSFHRAQQEGLTPFLAAVRNTGLEAFGLNFESVGVDQLTTMFDLALTASEADDTGLTLAMQYNTDIFERETIERMLRHFENLLAALGEQDDRPVSELPLLDEPELHQVIVEWNQTGPAAPAELCLHELFEQRAAERPQALAVASGQESLTYEQLNARANQLAAHLRELGVGLESMVGLSMTRGAGMIVGLFGILKAGASYVPIDADLPAERKRLICEDASINVVVTDSASAESFADFSGKLVRLDADAAEIARRRAANLGHIAESNNRAYIIYTSGSSGRPKGVEVEHRSIVNYALAAARQFTITPEDRVFQFASLSFDHSAEEIFPALATGAGVIIRDDSVSLLAGPFLAACEKHGVSVLIPPTAFWRQLTADMASGAIKLPNSIRLLVTGGESAGAEQVALWKRVAGPNVRFINNYGPTEATVVATAWEAPSQIDTGRPIPIGKSVPGTTAYVLDRNKQPVPACVAGELYIGGVGVARGYLNRPDQTAERFLASPFREGERLYRTGDLVRRRADGNIEFLGRIDHQVKIRGFRIELGEIESALSSHEGVRVAVVQPWNDPSGPSRLVAYVVPLADPPGEDELREFLKASLPEYMIPTAFVMLAELPRNKSDKIDRRALPAPTQSASNRQREYVAPRNDTERQLAEIWQGVLDVGQAGVRDNFFDLGGHSMLAVQLVSRVNRHFGCDLPLASLLQEGTIERMAVLIGLADEDRPWSPLVPIRPEGTRPPLFCVHPAGGNVLCYHELAQAMHDDQPVYALQSRGVDGKLAPYDTMTEMVAEYVTAIRSVQPSGPYHLAGWSSGGVVAYEIARVLEASGENIARVSLIDSRVMSAIDLLDPEDESRILAMLGDVLERFYGISVGITYEELQSLDSDARLALLLARVKVAGQAPLDIDIEYLRTFVSVARANLRAMRDYLPPASDLPVHLYRAAQRLGELDDNLGDDLGWAPIVGKSLVVHETPGDHINMMTGENVRTLAELFV